MLRPYFMILGFSGISFLAQQANVLPPWLDVVLGVGGVAAVSSLACWTLWKALQKKDTEIKDITEKSIEAILVVITKTEEMKDDNKEIKTLIKDIFNHVKGETQWKKEVNDRLEKLLTKRVT